MADKKTSAATQATAAAVAERLTASLTLHDADSKFQAVAETAPCAIFVYRDDKIVYGNHAGEVITGYTLPELHAIRVFDIIHPDFRQYIMERAAARKRGELGTSRYELRILPKD